MPTAPGNGSNQQEQAGGQADDGGVENAHVGKPSSYGLFQFSIGGIRLQPQRNSIDAATARKITRRLGDAAIPAWSIRLLFSSAVADRGRYRLVRLARGKTLRLADHRHQQSLIEQPLRDAARIVKGHRFDHGGAAAEIVGAEAVELQLHQ
jgi:hypothetical protein